MEGDSATDIGYAIVLRMISIRGLTLCGEGKMGGGGLQADEHQLPSKKSLCKYLLHPRMERVLGEVFLKTNSKSLFSPAVFLDDDRAPLSLPPLCYQLANLPAHSDTQLREMKTVLLIDETLDKITWF